MLLRIIKKTLIYNWKQQCCIVQNCLRYDFYSCLTVVTTYTYSCNRYNALSSCTVPIKVTFSWCIPIGPRSTWPTPYMKRGCTYFYLYPAGTNSISRFHRNLTALLQCRLPSWCRVTLCLDGVYQSLWLYDHWIDCCKIKNSVSWHVCAIFITYLIIGKVRCRRKSAFDWFYKTNAYICNVVSSVMKTGIVCAISVQFLPVLHYFWM